MRRLTMLATVLLMAASSVQADLTVQEFVDRIKTANAIDKWIDSGTITCTKIVDEVKGGQSNSYQTQSTITLDGDYAICDVHWRGFPILPPPSDPERQEDWKEGTPAEHVVLYLAPNETIAYFPEFNNAFLQQFNTTRVQGISAYSGAVLSLQFV